MTQVFLLIQMPCYTTADSTFVNDRRLINEIFVQVADGSLHPILASGLLIYNPSSKADLFLSFSHNLFGKFTLIK